MELSGVSCEQEIIWYSHLVNWFWSASTNCLIMPVNQSLLDWNSNVLRLNWTTRSFSIKNDWLFRKPPLLLKVILENFTLSDSMTQWHAHSCNSSHFATRLPPSSPSCTLQLAIQNLLAQSKTDRDGPILTDQHFFNARGRGNGFMQN